MKSALLLCGLLLVGSSALANPRNVTICPDAPTLAGKASPAYSRAVIPKVEGDYEWSYRGLLSGHEGQQYGDLSLVFVEGSETRMLLTGLVDYRYGLTDPEAVLDLAAGTLSIANNQTLGHDGIAPVVFYVKRLDDAARLVAGSSAQAATVGRLTEEGILFDEGDVWAIGNPSSEEGGYNLLAYANVLEAANRGDDRMQWEEYCTARFEDGWGVAGLTTDPVSSHSWYVSVQKSATTPGLFRIHNPYMEYQCPLPASYCESGDIEFNVRRPDFVWVTPEVESGLVFSGLKLCYTNLEGFHYSQGKTPEEIKKEITTSGGKVSTYSDNVVNIRNCRFNYKGAFDRASFWRDEAGGSLTHRMEAVLRPTVTLGDFQTDVEELRSADEAPVEYYSTDGRRLATPGGICIRRQGERVSKIVVR